MTAIFTSILGISLFLTVQVHGQAPVIHVPGGQQQVVHVPGQRIIHVPGGEQQVIHVPGQQIVHVPGGQQEVIHVPGQQIVHVPGGQQEVIHVPGQEVIHVPGQQEVVHVPGQQIFHVPGQQIFHVPGPEIIHRPGEVQIIHKQKEGEIIHKQTPAQITVKPLPGLIIVLGSSTYSIIRYLISENGQRTEIPSEQIIKPGTHYVNVLYLLPPNNAERIAIAEEEFIRSTVPQTIQRFILVNGARQQVYDSELVQLAHLATQRFVVLANGQRLPVYNINGLVPTSYDWVQILYIIFPDGTRIPVTEEEHFATSQSAVHVKRYIILNDATRKLVADQTLARVGNHVTIRYIILDDGSRKETTPGELVIPRLSTITILYNVRPGGRQSLVEEIYTPGYPYSFIRTYLVLPGDGTRQKISEIALRLPQFLISRYLILPDNSRKFFMAGELVPNNLQTLTIHYEIHPDGVYQEISHEEFIPGPPQDIRRIYFILFNGNQQKVSEDVLLPQSTFSHSWTVFILGPDGSRQQFSTGSTPPSGTSYVTVYYMISSSNPSSPITISEEEVIYGFGYTTIRRYVVFSDGTRRQVSEQIVPSTTTTSQTFLILPSGERQAVTPGQPVPRTSSITIIRYQVTNGQQIEYSQEDIIPGATTTIIRYFLILPNGGRKLISEETHSTSTNTYIASYLLLPTGGQGTEVSPYEPLPTTQNSVYIIYMTLPNGSKNPVSKQETIFSPTTVTSRVISLIGGSTDSITTEVLPRNPGSTMFLIIYVLNPDNTRRPKFPTEVIPQTINTVHVMYITSTEGNTPVTEEHYLNSPTVTIIRRFVLIPGGNPKQVSEDNVPSPANKIEVRVYYLLPDNTKQQLSTGEQFPTSHKVIRIVYLIAPDNTKQEYSNDEFTLVQGVTTTVHYLFINGQKKPTSTEVVPLTPAEPTYNTITITYLILDNGSQQEIPAGTTSPAGSRTITILYLILPTGEKKPVSSEEVNPNTSQGITVIILRTYYPDGSSKITQTKIVQSPTVTIVQYILLPNNQRQEVKPGQLVPSSSTIINVIYIVRPGGRVPHSEDEITITTKTTTTTVYIIVPSTGERQKQTTDVVPSVTTPFTVVIERFIISPTGTRTPVPSGQDVPEDAHSLTIVYLVQGTTKTEFSEEERIPSPTTITIIRYLINPQGQKDKISDHTEPTPERGVTTITIIYLVGPDGSKTPLQPGSTAPAGSRTITILYLVLPSGEKKPISSEEVIPSQTTTIVILRTFYPDGNSKVTHTQVVPSPAVTIIQYILLPNNQRQEVKPGQPAPSSSTIINVIYTLAPGGTPQPFSEDEFTITKQTTTTTVYIILPSGREKQTTDVVPSVTTPVTIVIEKFIVGPSGTRTPIPSGQDVPDDKHTLTIVYLVQGTTKTEFSEEERIPSPTSITIIRYVINPNGQKEKISEHVEQKPQTPGPNPSGNPTGGVTTITIVYLIAPDGSKTELPKNQPAPANSHTETIVYVIINGDKKPVQKTEVVPGTTTTTTTVSTFTPDGNEHTINTEEIPGKTVTVINYILLPNGEKQVVKPGQTVPNGSTTITITYIVTPSGQQKPYSETHTVIGSTTQTTVYIYTDNGKLQQVTEDTTPNPEVKTVTERFLVTPQGRQPLGPNDPIPSTASYVIVTYVVLPSGQKQPFSEEQVTVTQNSKTTTRYLITPGGDRQKLSENIEIIQQQYVVFGPDGSQKTVSRDEYIRLLQRATGNKPNNGQPIEPSTSTTYFIQNPDGSVRAVSREEFERIKSKSTSTGGNQFGGGTTVENKYYVLNPDGTQREVTAAEFAALQAAKSQNTGPTHTYFLTLPDGSRREVTEAEFRRLQISGEPTQKFYITDANGNQREVTQEEFLRIKAQGQTGGGSGQLYFITDAQGNQRQVTAAEYAKFQTGSGQFGGGQKFFITDANGNQREVTQEEFLRIKAQGQTGGGSGQLYFITDAQGNQRQVSAEEFAKFKSGGGQFGGSSQKYFVTDANGNQREVSAEEYARLQAGGGQSGGGQVYFVTDAQGNQRQVSAEEYARLQAGGGGQSGGGQTYFVTDAQGHQRQVSAEEYARLQAGGGGQSGGGQTYFVTDAPGNQRQVSAEEYARLQAGGGGGQSGGGQQYFVTDANGKQRAVSAAEFQQLQSQGGQVITQVVKRG